MTLNGVMAIKLRYFTEFGKPVFQPRRSVHGRIYDKSIVFCSIDVKNVGKKIKNVKNVKNVGKIQKRLKTL